MSVLASVGHCRKLGSDLDLLRGFFHLLSVPEVRGLITKASRGVIAMPWAGPVLLSWAGLLGQRELLARGPWCRETAVPRSSSSAQHSRAGGSERRGHGDSRGGERPWRQLAVGGC